MDIEIQHPTEYEIRQLCTASLVQYMSRPSTFAGVYQPKGRTHKTQSNAAQQIRIAGIHKESRIAGAQMGAQFRYRALHRLLNSASLRRLLDRIFNFSKVMRDSKIVLPVITEIEGSVEVAGNRLSARTTRRSWRIIKPARLSTAPLNWRTYLDLQALQTLEPKPISAFFAPFNRAERKAWRTGFCEGFEAGYRQADRQYALQLADLRRDFIGMWRFRQLEMQGIVTSPQVIETRLGTIVNDDVVFIDERDVRISVGTKFSAQSAWRNHQIK